MLKLNKYSYARTHTIRLMNFYGKKLFYYKSIFLCQIPQKREGCESVGPRIERGRESECTHIAYKFVYYTIFRCACEIVEMCIFAKLVEMLERMHSI